jgi:hypothetical protein
MLRNETGRGRWLVCRLRRNSQDLWMGFFSNYAATSVSCSSHRSAITPFQLIGRLPPSTMMVAPVTYPASSDSRNLTTGPMSSTGSPRYPMG